jgi:hypothetical protein
MANTVNYVLDINFKNALKAADEFASKLDSSISEAMKHNRGFTGLIQGFKRISEIQEKFDTKHKRYQELENLRQKKNSGELRKSIQDIAKQQDELNRKRSESVDLSAEETAELEKQEKALKRQLEAAEQNLAVAESSVAEHAALAKELAKEAKNIEVMAERIAQSAESAKELKASLKGLVDPSKLGENLESAAERAADAFKDGIDVQALSRDLGKGLGKGINVAFKAMSGIGGGGKLGTAILAVGGAIAGTVAALGLLVAAFIAVDKKVKEFNKGIVKTHGALSLMRMGGGDLDKGLRVVKRTVMDLTGNLGVSEEEAASLFDTLDKGGITLDRLTRGARDATDQQRMLTDSLRQMHSVANLMGVGLAEYADNLTNYVNDLGMSVDTVNESFASIANMAARSAFGTRRFYSMVVQATSGQASLNTRLEDTASLLMRMSKIMGAKKAAEMTGKYAQGLAGMSTQDRTRMAIQAGGRLGGILSGQATAQATAFAQGARGTTAAGPQGQASAMAQALSQAGLSTDIAEAIRRAGIGSPEEQAANTQTLIQSLQGMKRQQQEDIANAMINSTDETVQAQGRQMHQLIRVVRGIGGTMGDRTEAMSTFGPRGAMITAIAAVEGTIGRAFDASRPNDVAMLMATENIAQMSSEDRQQMTDLLSHGESTFRTLERLRSQNQNMTDEQALSSARQYGAIVRGNRIVQASVSANGELVTGAVIENGRDYILQQDAAATATEGAMDRAASVAQETMDATVSVADILENKVAQYLQDIYEWMSGTLQELILSLPGMSEHREEAARKRNIGEVIADKIKDITKDRSERAREISRLETRSRTLSGTERTQAEAEIVRLRRVQEEDLQRIGAYRETSRGVATGRIATTEQRTITHSRAADTALLDPDQMGVLERAVNGIQRLTGTGSGSTTPITETITREISAQELMRRAESQRGIRQRTMGDLPGMGVVPTGTATTTTPSAAPAGAPAPAPAAGTTPAGGAAPTPVATTPPPARVTEAANAPTVEAVTEAHEDAQAHNQRQRREQRQRNAIEDRNMERLIKGKEMGDGIAVSALPDAIATADAKMRLLEGLTEAQLHDPALVGRLLGGTATPQDIGGLAADRQGIARALGSRLAPTPNDFIYQNSGGRSVITPINSEDQIMGMRPGGPIANATGRGTGGNVTINVNGGDERRVFEVVRRAIQQAGITPNRVPSGAT